ncbi:Uncharacterised protein [Mycobacteroides abscessus subsp. abscessus]|nr:Uncharacterised protein [Mycobacteroides abscessus subsp. abscessus]
MPSSSGVIAPWTMSRVHTGESEVKIFTPVSSYPPSGVGTASVVEPWRTQSLPGSEMPKAKISPAMVSSKTQVRESSPRSASALATPVVMRCMLTASAVAGAVAARRCWRRATSKRLSPGPPWDSGTKSVR